MLLFSYYFKEVQENSFVILFNLLILFLFEGMYIRVYFVKKEDGCF